MTRALLLAGLLCLGSLDAANAQRRPLAQPLLGVGQNPPTSATANDFFDDNFVRDIRLDINTRDWQALKDNYQSNTYYPADFRWQDQVVRNVGIRSRGTASRSGVKPGLRVDFDRYTTDQKFLGLKSFILRNNATDPSSLHERISMGLFRRLGLPVSREAHVRLFISGAYAGLHMIVESPDKDFLARHFGENAGYLYKFDRNVGDAPYYFNYLGPEDSRYVPHPFKPETHESDPQPRPITDMIQVIEESSEAGFRAAIAPFIDLAAFVRHVAIENFLAETDGMLGESGMNNFYLYRPPGTRLHRLIPWDKSDTISSGPTFSIVHNIDDRPEPMRNRLMVRAMKWDDLKDLYFQSLLDAVGSAGALIPGDGRGWMEREVEREFQQIREAALSDPEKTHSNDQFLAAVEALRVFARERGAFVSGEVARHR